MEAAHSSRGSGSTPEPDRPCSQCSQLLRAFDELLGSPSQSAHIVGTKFLSPVSFLSFLFFPLQIFGPVPPVSKMLAPQSAWLCVAASSLLLSSSANAQTITVGGKTVGMSQSRLPIFKSTCQIAPATFPTFFIRTASPLAHQPPGNELCYSFANQSYK